MDNQHRQITGYGELDQGQIDKVNVIKAHGLRLADLVAGLRADPDADQRWVSIGATDLQIGLMALGRSVTNPTGF